MGENGEGLERGQQSDDGLLSRTGFADARLGGEPGRSRIAYVACAQEQGLGSNHDGVRSRSGRAGRHRAVFSGWTLAARFVRQNEIEIVRQDERLKRFAGLRAAQYAGNVRSDQRSVARACSASRTRTWRPCYLQHVESGAERKSVRRLEPERRTQNDDLRLLPSRQRRADRFHAGHMGRSRQLPEKEKSRSPEIPFRSNVSPGQKNGRPLRAGRETQTETTEEMRSAEHT